jgi:hypothetical protein
MMRSFIMCAPCQNDQAKEGEMDRACSMHGEKRNAYRIWVGKPKGKNH